MATGKSIAWIGLIVVAILYGTSFFLPAFRIPILTQPAMDRLKAEVAGRAGGGEIEHVDGPINREFDGLWCFRNGFSTDAFWYHRAAWFANPTLWFAGLLLILQKWRPAMFVSFVALALASVAAIAPLSDRSAVDIRWTWNDYRIGYWLWLGSMGTLLVFAFLGQRQSRGEAQSSLPSNIE